MAGPDTQDALIYLMVITSAADRDMTDVEMSRIGDVVRAWPIFIDFRIDRLVSVAQDCQRMLAGRDGMAVVIDTSRNAIPSHLHDTAYAAAFEVAAVDQEMRMEELRVLQLLRQALDIDPVVVAAIERANKARQKSLT